MADKSDGGCGCLLFVLIGGIIYWGYGAATTCSSYASSYSCGYVKYRAHYDVYYWRHVEDDDPDDERVIASATGLEECRSKAIEHAAAIQEPWNERSYICVLMEDGVPKEKHRLIEG